MKIKKIPVKSIPASRKEAEAIMESMVGAPGAKPFEGRLGFGAKTVRDIRTGLKMTQKTFASILFVELATVESWEQGRRVPDRSRMAMLIILRRHAKTFVPYLEQAGKEMKVA